MCKLRDEAMDRSGELPMEKMMEDREMFRPLDNLSGAAVRGEAVAKSVSDSREFHELAMDYRSASAFTEAPAAYKRLCDFVDALSPRAADAPSETSDLPQLTDAKIIEWAEGYLFSQKGFPHKLCFSRGRFIEAVRTILSHSPAHRAADAPSDLATLVEPIFTSWDGCDFDGIDIGAALRADFKTFVFSKSRAADALDSQPTEKATLGEVWATGGVHWDLFPGYLIDHCEGETITEEGLQSALGGMLKDVDYLRVTAERSQPAAAASQESIGDDALRERVRDAVADNLRGLYYCGRVWSAWSVGTMGEDDFSPAEDDDDIISNITDAVLATLDSRAPAAQAASVPDGWKRTGWFIYEGICWVATSSDDPRATQLYRAPQQEGSEAGNG